MVTNEEKAQLMETFKILDENGDGQLTREEIKKGYNKLEGIKDDELDALMSKLDGDNSGVIDYTEFIGAAINREQLLTRQRIEASFKLFDKDSNGGISTAELKQMFGGAKVKDDVWRELIKEVDGDDNGEIELDEFKDMLMKLI